MSGKRIVAIVLIFLLGVAGWVVLGSASLMRSYDATSMLDGSVQALWGAPIVQKAPSLKVKVPGSKRTRSLLSSANHVTVRLDLEQRRKGLIWYPTFLVDFVGRYAVTNSAGIAQNVLLHFPFPAANATYDKLAFGIDDQVQQVDIDTKEGIRHIIEVPAGQTRIFEVSFTTRGLFSWRYQFASESGRARNLQLLVDTNFKNLDFPESSLSPMTSEETAAGMRLTWMAEDLITRQDIGITMPEKINPGPLSARMSFFAPVCLLFFFVLVSAICILRKIDIHPMHYLFVNAGFFAFHLIFAYLVDIIDVHLAFLVAAVTSVVLVISYLATALGSRFPWKAAAAGQFFYLVLFSYSFFLKGMTGLTITVASVVTLAVLMRMTARLNWVDVFGSGHAASVSAEA
ncbi:MAG: inner membrane CreD family protein [Gammaproteobacteria bacterium]|nr:inner membrane CreD family protein [Gammaproteobacteria bacterium]